MGDVDFFSDVDDSHSRKISSVMHKCYAFKKKIFEPDFSDFLIYILIKITKNDEIKNDLLIFCFIK
jgi:hypothetical protein